jgi:pSer/pThr/pTyr-binding forkhead associated (FHA) protein
MPPMVPGAAVPNAPLGGTLDNVQPPRPIPQAGGAPVLIGFLVTFQNEPTGKFWPLRSGRTVLGRAGVENEASVALQDASASARHAVVQGDPSTGQAFVEDAGSRNGTFVNEQKLEKGVQRQLHDNDRLRLGSITLVVKLLAAT